MRPWRPVAFVAISVDPSAALLAPGWEFVGMCISDMHDRVQRSADGLRRLVRIKAYVGSRPRRMRPPWRASMCIPSTAQSPSHSLWLRLRVHCSFERICVRGAFELRLLRGVVHIFGAKLDPSAAPIRVCIPTGFGSLLIEGLSASAVSSVYICTAPGLGTLIPHLRRDWAPSFHIYAGTGRARATTSSPRLHSSHAFSRADVAHL
jgi:hypothetical protein